MQNVTEWLAAYDALDGERATVDEAMEDAETTCDYSHADEIRADLNERLAVLADTAADLLRGIEAA